MNHLDRSIARARRRITLGAAVHWLGVCLLAAIGVGCLEIGARHVVAWESTPWWVYAILGGLAGIAAIVIATARRPSIGQTAVAMDERLGLKDRIGTALYARTIKDQDPLAATVIDDAEKAALAAQIDRVAPLRFGRVWHWVPVGAAVFALLLAFVGTAPPADPFGFQAKIQEQQEKDAQAQAVERNIVQAKALIQDISSEDRAEMQELQTTELLKEIAALSRKDLGNPEMQRQTVARLANVKDKLARAKDVREEQFNAIQSQMSKLDPGDGPAKKFADAMRRGDFKSAADELESLAEQIDKGELSQQQKQQLQQQLQNMQQQLTQMAQQAQQQQQQAQQNMQQQLQNAGFSPQQAQQMAQQFQNGQMSQQQLQQQIQKQLQQQGQSPQQAQQQAQQTAKNMQQQKQQSQQAGQCSQCAGGLSSSLGQMSQSMQQQNQQGNQGQQGQGQQPSAQQSSFSAQQQLTQMAQMQQQIQQMGQAQQQMQQAMNQMSGQQGQGQGQQGMGQGQFGMGMNQGGGGKAGNQPGGRKAGTGDGGNPYGAHRQVQGYNTEYKGDIKEGEGRVIASWMTEGQNVAGESKVEFDQTVTAARDQAEKAVSDDRVPRRYHETIREYFRQLPESPDQVREAPAAPR